MAQHVDVFVENNGIRLDPEELRMGKNNPKQVIQWEIRTANWTFPDNGIVVNWDPGKQFSGPAANGNRTKFMIHNENSDFESYKYIVTLAYGPTTISKDPTIINGKD